VAILVLNPGSSTLKYAIFPGDERGQAKSVDEVLARTGGIDAVGVRVVHGGSKFVEPVVVDDAVLDEIRRLAELAPLHNPLAVRVIEDVRKALPRIPVIAAFDTAFHQTIPEVAYAYAVPRDLNVRRYGFHGLSYAYVSKRLRDLSAGPRQIICHLGNGASVCALRDGRSVDTSMGFTPMEGLVMGTRGGDIDPGVILYLLRGAATESALDDILNHRSGLLALSQRSGDVRELEAAADPASELALEVFAYRARKYIGAYAAALGGVDALAFTAGIGEHSASMRSRICRNLEFLGIRLNETLNREQRSDERRISDGAVDVWVIPTNEELEIARSVSDLLAR
jgi:acetate kinase